MTTIFLSGSRKLSRINDAIRHRLDNMISKNMDIIVGDANGADKAMQGYLAECGYQNVIVYFVGGLCRNNMGNWTTENVVADPKLSGRDFYAEKDKKMAQLADIGLVLWDGKSAGSIHNVFELIKNNKKAVVYYGPEKEFYNISSLEDTNILLKKCDSETYDAMRKKLGITRSMRELESRKQPAFNFLHKSP